MDSPGRRPPQPAKASLAAATTPAPPPSALWRRFDAQQAVRRARTDHLAAAVLIACCIAARGRVGELPTVEAEAHSFTVLALCISIMLTAGELASRGHHWARR